LLQHYTIIYVLNKLINFMVQTSDLSWIADIQLLQIFPRL
jgi:hypothetical protein